MSIEDFVHRVNGLISAGRFADLGVPQVRIEGTTAWGAWLRINCRQGGFGRRPQLLVPFVTGPYCDINPLYLANTSCTYSCSGCSERCLSWVDLEVNCCWSVPILYIKKFPPTHPGEVDCRPPLAVWCVFASAIEQYSPSQKDSVRRA